MAAWLEHAECQLQAVDQVFFAVCHTQSYQKVASTPTVRVGVYKILDTAVHLPKQYHGLGDWPSFARFFHPPVRPTSCSHLGNHKLTVDPFSDDHHTEVCSAYDFKD